MSLEIYYHPSVSLKNISTKDISSWGNLRIAPVESFIVNLHNEDSNIQHFPDDIFYNISDKYQINIDKDGTIRNDRTLNFIRDCFFEKKFMSIFLVDLFAEQPFNKEDSKRLSIIAFGNEFDLPTKHTAESPLNKNNKALFISKFFEYSMPRQVVSEEVIKKHLKKF